MAATVTLEKTTVTMKLNDGTTTTGGVKTVSVSLGNLDKTAFNADKALEVINLIVPCLAKSLYTIAKTDSSTITEAA